MSGPHDWDDANEAQQTLEDDPGRRAAAAPAARRISTAALASGSASNDSRYAQLESQLSAITTQRDPLASKMSGIISAAAFSGRAIDEDQAERLIDQGRDLLERVTDLANDQA